MRHAKRRSTLLTVAALLLATGFVTPGTSAAADEGGGYVTTLHRAVASLPVDQEHNDGYKRSSFKHWTDEDKDGCPTRSEVLQEESLAAVTTGPGCKVTGGRWLSYYDGQEISDVRKLDIDHLVPLLESWGSGAWSWSADRRERYANDLGDSRALVAVSAQQNRSKGGKDPAEWLPAAEGARCRYVSEWTAVKLRWGLSADPGEHGMLKQLAAACPDDQLKVILAAPGGQEGP
ncbi:HNH endonuclease family protein [Streptomyces violaceusniger]|uniref:GmrSD restriction endonucleases C-terminal domain-containing protein n=1 Tax=Streptomyces violaceusniger (strain Tu 4113) TaxID=653045 RepID=G2PHZ4_STRV4|nr:HNH endonuclease family protein [Streptomyces violaceusniger]AEM88945.1 Domain of unknown function DUF1994-containing protein [Streptomyces violaceusniger Tu 4113]